jgi:hypothetical protein
MITNSPRLDSFALGARSEERFKKIALHKGFSCRPSTKEENIKAHIDYFLSFENLFFSVDVKSFKRISRSSKTFDLDWVVVELKNVLGNKGWLYGGANVIAFEREFDFLLVGRNFLKNFVESLNINPKLVSSSDLAKYRLYQRRGRKDLITYIKSSDLLKIQGIKIWKKI